MNQLIKAESSCHDRAEIVIKQILLQIGFDADKLRMITQMASTISFLPSIGPLAQLQGLLKEIEPLMLLAQENNDPGYYLKVIPEEKLLYFIDQVTERLEWVKNGDDVTESRYTGE